MNDELQNTPWYKTVGLGLKDAGMTIFHGGRLMLLGVTDLVLLKPCTAVCFSEKPETDVEAEAAKS